MAELFRKEDLTLYPSTSTIKITFEQREDGTPNISKPVIKYYYRDYDQNSVPRKAGIITLRPSDLDPSDLYAVLTIFKNYFDVKYKEREGLE